MIIEKKQRGMIKIIKMTPVEWLEMDLKECIDWDKSFQDTFDKAKEGEFEIIDEFGKFLIYDKWQFNIENNCWESKCHSYTFDTLRGVYKVFLRERSKYK